MSALSLPPRYRRRGATRAEPALRVSWQTVVRALALGLMLGVLGLTLAVVKEMLQMPVRDVAINGDFRYLDKHVVRQVLQPFVDQPYFSMSLPALRTALEALPWVHRAGVRRTWPAGLSVVLVEQRPVAWWGDRQLVNSEGELYRAGSVKPEQALPLLEGPVGTQLEVMARFREVGALLGAAGMTVRSVQLSERGAWRMALDGDLELVLGRRQVTEKLRRFLAVYERALQPYREEIRRVDLRYQNGLSVQWRPDYHPQREALGLR